MSRFSHNILTRTASFLILAVVLFSLFTERKWDDPNNVISGDVKGYYGYLPALFINHDIRLTNDAPYHSDQGTRIWYMTDEKGNRYIKYTCGLAMLYSPFFAVAQMVAEPMGHPADGYSLPYRFALAMSAVFYLIIGLIFLSRLLLRYFDDHVVAVTLLIVFIGTNALHYYTGNMTYSHGYSLALISVFLYYTVRWLEQPKFRYAWWIGLSAGLFVLIRPVDVLFLLALPLLGVSSVRLLRERFSLFLTHWKQIVLMIVLAVLVFLPQFLYNYTVFGELFHYSYNQETFFFSDPHTLDALFSYRNGWLVYSPLMILSLGGLFVLGKWRSFFGPFLFPVIALYIYVITAWWCWWYVGFGNRAFINLYPLLAISLAAFLHFVYRGKWLPKLILNLFILCGLALSAFQTYQYDRWTIHWGAMTHDAYWDSFFRTQPSQVFDTLVRHPVEKYQWVGIDKVYTPDQQIVHSNYYSFESERTCPAVLRDHLKKGTGRYGNGCLQVREGEEFPGGVFPVSIKGADAIYITAWIKDVPEDVHLTISRIEPVAFYHASNEVWRRDGDWSKVHLFRWIPPELGADSVDFVLWNQGKHGFLLDDLKIRTIKFNYHPENAE